MAASPSPLSQDARGCAGTGPAVFRKADATCAFRPRSAPAGRPAHPRDPALRFTARGRHVPRGDQGSHVVSLVPHQPRPEGLNALSRTSDDVPHPHGIIGGLIRSGSAVGSATGRRARARAAGRRRRRRPAGSGRSLARSWFGIVRVAREDERPLGSERRREASRRRSGVRSRMSDEMGADHGAPAAPDLHEPRAGVLRTGVRRLDRGSASMLISDLESAFDAVRGPKRAADDRRSRRAPGRVAGRRRTMTRLPHRPAMRSACSGRADSSGAPGPARARVVWPGEVSAVRCRAGRAAPQRRGAWSATVGRRAPAGRAGGA